MLRLLFCTAAILPIGLIPWITSDADTIDALVEPESYAELITDPSIESLSDCQMGELPVFFNEGLVTSHSAAFIAEGLEAVEGCGATDVTIVPMLPEDATYEDRMVTQARTAELVEHIGAVDRMTETDIDLDVAQRPQTEEISTLYINGRAAILRIEPEDDAG